MATSDSKSGKPCSATEIAEQACRTDDEREWNMQEENGDEGRRSEGDHHAVLQGSLANADNRMENHRKHGAAIVPGKADESLLYKLLAGPVTIDNKEVSAMPKPSSISPGLSQPNVPTASWAT